MDDWIVVPKRDRVAVTAQLLRYIHLLTLFQLKDEFFFDQLDTEKGAFNEELVDQLTTSQHKLDIVEPALYYLLVELVSEFDTRRTVLIHMQIVDNDMLEDILALAFAGGGSESRVQLINVLVLDARPRAIHIGILRLRLIILVICDYSRRYRLLLLTYGQEFSDHFQFGLLSSSFAVVRNQVHEL